MEKQTEAFVKNIRRKMTNILKKNGIEYKADRYIYSVYNGDGFYINHRDKVCQVQPVYGYDIHSAYAGILKEHNYPLSSRLGTEPTDIGIYIIKYRFKKKRYKDFYYTLYENNTYNSNGEYITLMTNLDYLIFDDLYDHDGVVIQKLYFQDTGKLPVEYIQMIESLYQDKKNEEISKEEFLALVYGLNCKILNPEKIEKKKKRYATQWELEQYREIYEELNPSYEATPFKDIRARLTPIAIFQTAYLRFKEWFQFKQNIDSVIYMNTDSILCDKPLNIECKNEMGEYDVCYNGEKIQFIRRNSYIVIANNEIKKWVIGGVPEELNKDITLEAFKKLRDKRSIEYKEGLTLRTYVSEDSEETKPIKLLPLFLKMKEGEFVAKHDFNI